MVVPIAFGHVVISHVIIDHMHGYSLHAEWLVEHEIGPDMHAAWHAGWLYIVGGQMAGSQFKAWRQAQGGGDCACCQHRH